MDSCNVSGVGPRDSSLEAGQSERAGVLGRLIRRVELESDSAVEQATSSTAALGRTTDESSSEYTSDGSDSEDSEAVVAGNYSVAKVVENFLGTLEVVLVGIVLYYTNPAGANDDSFW